MKPTGKTLDERDHRIMYLITRGHTYKEIAKTVYISVDTINRRISIMKSYYNCKTIAELIAHLTEEGILH